LIFVSSRLRVDFKFSFSRTGVPAGLCRTLGQGPTVAVTAARWIATALRASRGIARGYGPVSPNASKVRTPTGITQSPSADRAFVVARSKL